MERETRYGPWVYEHLEEAYPYDDTETYKLAGKWLSGGGKQVEDWGGGTGWAKRYMTDVDYVLVDGAWSQWAAKQVDLREYRSDTPRALMRHVLEHNSDWRKIAQNFSDSWHERAVLVLFIQPQLEDIYMSTPDWPVPDIAVSGPDLMEILDQHGTKIDYRQFWYPPEHTIQYGWEGIFLMER